jgi:hypothetical protein
MQKANLSWQLDNGECPICYTDYTDKKRISLTNMKPLEECECIHSICKECFINAFKDNYFNNEYEKIKCPLCRYNWCDLIKYLQRKRCIINIDEINDFPFMTFLEVTYLDENDVRKNIIINTDPRKKTPLWLISSILQCDDNGFNREIIIKFMEFISFRREYIDYICRLIMKLTSYEDMKTDEAMIKVMELDDGDSLLDYDKEYNHNYISDEYTNYYIQADYNSYEDF